MAGEFRRSFCCRKCKTSTGCKVHEKACDRRTKTRVMRGPTVEVVRRHKRAKLESLKQQVECEGAPLENVFSFCYLGCSPQADGDPKHAVVVRLAQSKSRCGKLHHLWSTSALGMRLKLRLHAAAVCSILAHGSEAWVLTAGMCKSLRHWNACCLSVITGREIREASFDLLSQAH